MATEIKCPHCGQSFELTSSLREEIQREVNARADEWKKRKEKELEESVRRNIVADYESKLKLAEQNNKDIEIKLKEARQQQAEFLRKEQELKTREAELDLTVQQKLLTERDRISAEIRKLEEQRMAAREMEYQLQMKEMKEKMEAQKKLVDEMKRKAEQGSVQLQGETQEILLEDLLRNAFPFDTISPVGKGIRGADCIQLIRNSLGQECGKIIFESKRTERFANEWTEKLKADMRSQKADVAVIVTRAMPKEMPAFGEKDGVWICSFTDALPLAQVLRMGIIKVFAAAKSQENKGDKMQMLYHYFTSPEFFEQWKAMREGFLQMRGSIQKERDAMEKLWKQREKQLEKILLNATHIQGSIEGISGADVNLDLLEENGVDPDSE